MPLTEMIVGSNSLATGFMQFHLIRVNSNKMHMLLFPHDRGSSNYFLQHL
jgi:hypothetical protein